MNRHVDTLASLLRGASRNALLLGLLALGFLLVLPLPTPLLSLLLVLDLALSALVLATLLRAPGVHRVTTLPTILLLGALFRLALNIASSRLILTDGDAGAVVESVGRLLTDGHWAVGLLLYGMVSLVQWMVINQGSARVAEVAARFALDAMPVRMLALDQEAKAGRLDGAELDRRRAALLEEANWQGAMDGASRFVRGDALVGLIIALINLVAGTMLGLLRDGQSFETAIDTYTTLAIGDGLVSQIPSLLLSVGAAIAVTRAGASSTPGGLSARMFDEFAAAPRQLLVAGLWVAAFALVPDLPAWPFMTVGAALALIGVAGQRGRWGQGEAASLEPATLWLPSAAQAIWRTGAGSEQQLAARMQARWGLYPPLLRVASEPSEGSAAVVVWQGAQVARWTPVAGDASALDTEVVERSHHLCARALTEASAARLVGATGRPLPSTVSLPLATEALRRCLAEGVSITRLERLLRAWEAAGAGPFTARQLLELAREAALTEQLVLLSRDGQLPALLVTPSVEQELRASLRLGAVTEEGELPQAIREAVDEAIAGVVVAGGRAFVVSQDVRWLFAPIAARRFPAIPVYGHREVRHAGLELAVVARVTAR